MTFNTQDYSSCLFRIPENGGRVLWEITNSCNYSCSYCIFSSSPGKINGELSTQDTYRVLEELKQEGFTHIKFTGGEPFIRKDLVSILERASYLGFRSDLSTNASMINEKNARKLSNVNLEMIHVSIDGNTKEIQERIRGENTYEKTLRGIKNIKEYTNHYLRIGTVLYNGNENSIEDMVKLYSELGADEVIFSRMEPMGRIEGNSIFNARKNDDLLEKEIFKLKQKYSKQIKINTSFNSRKIDSNCGTCPAVNKFLFIDNLGRVSPCTWLVEKDPKYRSTLTLKETSLAKILESEPIQNFLSQIKIFEKNKEFGCPAKKLKKTIEIKNEI